VRQPVCPGSAATHCYPVSLAKSEDWVNFRPQSLAKRRGGIVGLIGEAVWRLELAPGCCEVEYDLPRETGGLSECPYIPGGGFRYADLRI
jgi:hypothetical protein